MQLLQIYKNAFKIPWKIDVRTFNWNGSIQFYQFSTLSLAWLWTSRSWNINNYTYLLHHPSPPNSCQPLYSLIKIKNEWIINKENYIIIRMNFLFIAFAFAFATKCRDAVWMGIQLRRFSCNKMCWQQWWICWHSIESKFHQMADIDAEEMATSEWCGVFVRVCDCACVANCQCLPYTQTICHEHSRQARTERGTISFW